MASARWVNGGRRGGGDPHRPGTGLHSCRGGRVRGPDRAWVDRRDPQARTPAVGGQDLCRPRRRRDRDPVQSLTLDPMARGGVALYLRERAANQWGGCQSAGLRLIRAARIALEVGDDRAVIRPELVLFPWLGAALEVGKEVLV